MRTAGMVEIIRKINLTRTLDIMANLFPDEFDFHPQSWFLPQQFPEFADAFRRMLVSANQIGSREREIQVTDFQDNSEGSPQGG